MKGKTKYQQLPQWQSPNMPVILLHQPSFLNNNLGILYLENEREREWEQSRPSLRPAFFPLPRGVGDRDRDREKEREKDLCRPLNHGRDRIKLLEKNIDHFHLQFHQELQSCIQLTHMNFLIFDVFHKDWDFLNAFLFSYSQGLGTCDLCTREQ